MNLKIDMYIRVPRWDNDLVNQKEEQNEARQYHRHEEKGNTMAEVTFTEKELGFINECAIDKKGVLVEMPANPFPSLYRKGVIAKKGDDLTVTKDFREMFCLDGQVVQIDLTEAEGGPGGTD